MTDINLLLQIGVLINAFSIVICSAMIIYFVVLASSFNVNAGCLNLLDYRDYNDYIWSSSRVQVENGTTGDVYWLWSGYHYGAGVYVTMLVCLCGWVSDI